MSGFLDAGINPQTRLPMVYETPQVHRTLQDVLINYCVAVGSIILAFFIRVFLDPLFGEGYPYITFIIAIMFTAWHGTLGPSLLAVVLGFMATNYFFLYPRGSLEVHGLGAQVGMALYLVVGLSSVFLSELMHAANRRANTNADELLKKQRELEHEIVERREAQMAQVGLLRRLVNVQEEERRRISRELHDQCGQDLTALHLAIKRLEPMISGDPEVTRQFKTVHQLLDQISQEMHHLAQELRPPALDELGLVTAVQSYLQTWSLRTSIPTDFEFQGVNRNRISPDIEIALYRILQEALTNIVKHAEATGVSVVLKQNEQEVQMIIEDQGKGFNVESKTLSTGVRQHLGLLGIRERIEAVGGRLDIESSTGVGTTLFARVPLSPKGAASG